ncbi:MAG: hypothetical protein WCK15_19555, partial [Pirellula sp.]
MKNIYRCARSQVDTPFAPQGVRTSERATQLTSRFQTARRLRLRQKGQGPLQLYRPILSTNIIDQ